MKIKTSELQGAALDWAAAKCEGFDTRNNYRVWVTIDNEQIIFDCCADDWEHAYEQALDSYPNGRPAATDELPDYTPSTNWAQGGPIIDREKICVYEMPGHVGGKFRAEKNRTGLPPNVNGVHYAAGNTYLKTAMRCFVSSRLGDEVEIPEELT